MREYLFRGKRKDNGAWETGSLIFIEKAYVSGEKWHIVEKTGSYTPVIEDTVGQYIGITDANGVKVFEGDIARKDNMVLEVCYGYFLPKIIGDALKANNKPVFPIIGVYFLCVETHKKYVIPDSGKFEIIGNRYDNREYLIKEFLDGVKKLKGADK